MGVKLDWTFKVSDIIKLTAMLVLSITAFIHLQDEVNKNHEDISATNVQLTKVTATLADHIEKQNEATDKLNLLLDRFTVILQEYPPHRHTGHGEVIYPHDGNFTPNPLR